MSSLNWRCCAKNLGKLKLEYDYSLFSWFRKEIMKSRREVAETQNRVRREHYGNKKNVTLGEL